MDEEEIPILMRTYTYCFLYQYTKQNFAFLQNSHTSKFYDAIFQPKDVLQ